MIKRVFFLTSNICNLQISFFVFILLVKQLDRESMLKKFYQNVDLFYLQFTCLINRLGSNNHFYVFSFLCLFICNSQCLEPLVGRYLNSWCVIDIQYTHLRGNSFSILAKDWITIKDSVTGGQSVRKAISR